jgi:chromosome segregation ATPase
LKSRHEAEKQTFEKKILELQDKLSVKDETAGELEKSTMKDTSVMKKGNTSMEEHEEFANPADLLKSRLSKWTTNNKEKKHLLDKYIKNVKIIEDAFEQIREQTGISSIDEIVTTFIKAEEQNYSLYNYVNILNNDIDTIEEQNKSIASEMKKNKERSALYEKEQGILIQELKDEIESVNANMSDKDKEMEELENKMSKIQSSVQKMVTKFQESKFRPAVTQPMNYDEDTVFNNKNITLFLAELEEYISELITHNEYRKNNPNAAIAAIPLEKLHPKSLDKGTTKPELPSKDEIKITEDAVEQEDDKEIVISGKDLYKKFEDLVKKNQITYSSIKNASNSRTHA